MPSRSIVRMFPFLVLAVVLASSGSSVSVTVASPAVAGWHPPASCSSSDPIVRDAIQKTMKRTGPQTQWYGPKSGPKPRSGVSIVYMAANAQNAVERLWGDEVQKAAAIIGWKTTQIDGKGTSQGWIEGLTQAIALKPRVIIYSADGNTLKDLNAQANAQGIKVIGIHAAGLPGPHPEANLFSNMSSDPKQIGEAEADYIIADSCGRGRAIVLYDANYQIARMKAQAMKDRFTQCKTCRLLDYVNSPIADITTQMPPLFTSWAAKYGKGWYVMDIYDGYYDYAVPALKAAGYGPRDVHLVGSDGILSAYERIRSGQFQVATVPEPAQQLALMAVDDAVRAVAGQPPANWTQPVYLVTKDNINIEGGSQNQFYPSNNALARYEALWGVK